MIRDALANLIAALPQCWAPGCGLPATKCHAYADDLTCDDCDTGYKGAPETHDLPYAAALRAAESMLATNTPDGLALSRKVTDDRDH